MAKKPWRPIVVIEDENTGRFTRRQIEDAVRVVKERNEARNKKNGRHPDTTKPVDADRKSKASSAPKPKRVAAVHPRAKSKM